MTDIFSTAVFVFNSSKSVQKTWPYIVRIGKCRDKFRLLFCLHIHCPLMASDRTLLKHSHGLGFSVCILYFPSAVAFILWLLLKTPHYSINLPSSSLFPCLFLCLSLWSSLYLKLSGCLSGRMSTIDLYRQHFSNDGGLWVVPNRI